MIDTHCHLNDPQFEPDLPGVLRRAQAAGVTACLVAGYDAQSSERAAAMAGKVYGPDAAGVFVALGLHPHDASFADGNPNWLGDLRSSLQSTPRVAAVGEMGLDYHYTLSPPDTQERVFRAQIRLAHDLGLPITVHSRAAEDRVVDILAEETPPAAGAVLHSFTGTPPQMERAVSLGLHIGVTGMITFKNSGQLRDMIRRVPPERLLIETDAPYLAPHPLRGKRNEPAFLAHIRPVLAALLGLTEEVVDVATTRNATRLFARLSAAG